MKASSQCLNYKGIVDYASDKRVYVCNIDAALDILIILEIIEYIENKIDNTAIHVLLLHYDIYLSKPYHANNSTILCQIRKN